MDLRQMSHQMEASSGTSRGQQSRRELRELLVHPLRRAIAMNTPLDDAPDTIATTLAEFVTHLRLNEVAPAVLLRAKHLMLDAIGCGLAARRDAFAQHLDRKST